jgi:hypothetical protein
MKEVSIEVLIKKICRSSSVLARAVSLMQQLGDRRRHTPVPRCLSVLPRPLSLPLLFVLCETGHLNPNLNYLAISRSYLITSVLDGY